MLYKILYNYRTQQLTDQRIPCPIPFISLIQKNYIIPWPSNSRLGPGGGVWGKSTTNVSRSYDQNPLIYTNHSKPCLEIQLPLGPKYRPFVQATDVKHSYSTSYVLECLWSYTNSSSTFSMPHLLPTSAGTGRPVHQGTICVTRVTCRILMTKIKSGGVNYLLLST